MPRQSISTDKPLAERLNVDMSEEPLIIERDGKPAFAVMPYETFERLIDQLEDLIDIQAADEAIEEYRRDPNSAKSLEEVEADLGLEHETRV